MVLPVPKARSGETLRKGGLPGAAPRGTAGVTGASGKGQSWRRDPQHPAPGKWRAGAPSPSFISPARAEITQIPCVQVRQLPAGKGCWTVTARARAVPGARQTPPLPPLLLCSSRWPPLAQRGWPRGAGACSVSPPWDRGAQRKGSGKGLGFPVRANLHAELGGGGEGQRGRLGFGAGVGEGRAAAPGGPGAAGRWLSGGRLCTGPWRGPRRHRRQGGPGGSARRWGADEPTRGQLTNANGIFF